MKPQIPPHSRVVDLRSAAARVPNLALLKTLDEQVEVVTVEIAKTACNDEDIQILMTLSGLDFYSAMVMASEIGDVKRFPTQWKLVAYAGLAPRIHQPGEYERRGGKTCSLSRENLSE